MSVSNVNWRLALFSSFFLGLFLFLGTWQLQRGEEKTQMLVEADRVAGLPGQMLGAGSLVKNGDPVRLEGQFDPTRVFLLDNRVLQGKVGYEVVQLFESTDGLAALVNRGFVQGGRTRDILPEIPAASSGRQMIRGHAYLTELAVPPNNVAGTTSPWVIQVAVPAFLGKVAGEDLFDRVIRLEEAHPDALPRFWPVTTISPERHMGYAVTWYLMAIAVIAAFIFSVRHNDSEATHE